MFEEKLKRSLLQEGEIERESQLLNDGSNPIAASQIKAYRVNLSPEKQNRITDGRDRLASKCLGGKFPRERKKERDPGPASPHTRIIVLLPVEKPRNMMVRKCPRNQE